MNTTPATSWRPGDLEAIRIALGISATRPGVEAINQAMLQLEQGYADAIPTAQALLDQIGGLLRLAGPQGQRALGKQDASVAGIQFLGSHQRAGGLLVLAATQLGFRQQDPATGIIRQQLHR